MVLWVSAPCISWIFWCLRGMYCLHPHCGIWFRQVVKRCRGHKFIHYVGRFELVQQVTTTVGGKRWKDCSKPMWAKISRAAFFRSSPVGDVKIMRMVTVVESLPAMTQHWTGLALAWMPFFSHVDCSLTRGRDSASVTIHMTFTYATGEAWKMATLEVFNSLWLGTILSPHLS
jgi:hypothetical protein